MKLRNHHRFVPVRHIPTWPPLWTQSTRPNLKTVKGEVGFLKYVHSGGDRSTKCYLVIEHEKQSFVGVLSLGNLRFCAQITGLLQGNIGRSIKEIGDLEILDDELGAMASQLLPDGRWNIFPATSARTHKFNLRASIRALNGRFSTAVQRRFR